jgi:hypothetical protein
MTSKNKEPKHIETEPLDFLDEIKESVYFQWLVENSKYLPIAFGILLISIALIFKFTSSRASKAETNYLLAENYFEILTRSLQNEGGSEETLATLDKLTNVTNAYPELHSRYDGLIAQVLLAMEKNKEAKIFAERTLARTAKDHTPLHIAFSKITLLIGDGSYNQALADSKELQKILENPGNYLNNFANLFAYNILRIAMLEQKAGTPTGEKEAWQEWKKYSVQTDNPVLEQAFINLNTQLKEGEFSLDQYINARGIALSKTP